MGPLRSTAARPTPSICVSSRSYLPTRTALAMADATGRAAGYPVRRAGRTHPAPRAYAPRTPRVAHRAASRSAGPPWAHASAADPPCDPAHRGCTAPRLGRSRSRRTRSYGSTAVILSGERPRDVRTTALDPATSMSCPTRGRAGPRGRAQGGSGSHGTPPGAGHRPPTLPHSVVHPRRRLSTLDGDTSPVLKPLREAFSLQDAVIMKRP